MLKGLRDMLNRRPAAHKRPAAGGGRRLLTAAQVKAIRRRVAAGESQRKVAAEFGMSQPAISNICRYRAYADIP